jgi:hypothetical protein
MNAGKHFGRGGVEHFLKFYVDKLHAYYVIYTQVFRENFEITIKFVRSVIFLIHFF